MALYPSSYTVEHFHNDDGTLLSGGTLEFYIAGTSTPTPFYIDSAATLGGTSVTLNARGEPEVSGNAVIIWLSSDVNYKVVAKNALGGTEWTQDNLAAANAGGSAAEIAAADFSQWPSITLNGSDTAHDIDFTAGRIADTTGAELLVLASAMTKQIDAAWGVGNNQGGLFSGTVATSTTYYCFLIESNADQSIDCGFDTSSTAANIPGGYTKYRRIASFQTDGSANIDANSFIYLLHAEIAKRGENNGTCPLNESGIVPLANLSQNIDTMKTDLDAAEAAIISNDGDITALQTGKANTSGTYASLRAQATTKADVGLGSVNNYGASSSVASNSTSTYATTALTNDLYGWLPYQAAYNGVGQIALLQSTSVSTNFTAGSTYSASGLNYSGFNNTDTGSFCYGGINSNNTVSGTWRALGTVLGRADRYSCTLFVRIS